MDQDTHKLVMKLFQIVRQLQALHGKKRFTLDGHLLGSLGEVIAEKKFGLEPAPNSTPGYDAIEKSGKRRKVQIKITQVNKVGLRSEPQHLLVMKLGSEGMEPDVYNGPGHIAWKESGKIQSNGQRYISLGQLKKLNQGIAKNDQLQAI